MKVTVYSKSWCPYCVRAKQLLASLAVDVEEIDIEQEPERRAEMIDLAGAHTVPQIWVGNQHVGGCDELFELHHDGRLEPMLAGAETAG